MKKAFLFIFLSFITIPSNAENDSLNKKSTVFAGISISPNLTFRDYTFYAKKARGSSSIRKGKLKTPGIGLGCNVFLGVKRKNSTVTFGLGLETNSYKDVLEYSDPILGSVITTTYQYDHLFINLPIKYLKSIGKEKKWIYGFNAELSSLFKYEIKRTIIGSNTTTPINIYHYDIPQFVFWGGLEFGRKIKFEKFLQLNLSVSLKYSSYINGYIHQNGVEDATDRNLVVTSINLVFCPNLK